MANPYEVITTDNFLRQLDRSRPSAFFDIDHTVIYPIGKKRFYSPKDGYAWDINPLAKSVFKEIIAPNYVIYFVTNQLKYDDIVRSRIIDMLKYLEIEACVLIATQRNIYRKPGVGLIHGPHLVPIPGGPPTIDPIRSFHCGDAAGRAYDFSDDDLWFALHLGIKFYTPEEMFNTTSPLSKPGNGRAMIPARVDHGLIRVLTDYYKKYRGIILVGLPGSGKTYVREWMVETFSDGPKEIVVVNNDERKDLIGSFSKDKFYIIDNTNLKEAERSKYPSDFKIFYIDITPKEAIRGINYRVTMEDGLHVPDIAINTMNKNKEPPINPDIHLVNERPVLDDFFPHYLEII